MDYKKIYNQIIERAQTRVLEGYKEKHHIVPKCLGGKDDKENLVELTAREHFICHMLLCEIYPDNKKLWYALFLMSIGKKTKKKNNYKVSARLYERLKIKHSKFLTGSKHSKITRKKMSESRKGIKHTEESKKKMGESRKGHEMYNDEWREKISKSLKGKKRTKKQKNNIAKGMKGNTNRRKKISQFDMEGNFIKEWDSMLEAAQSLGKLQGAAISEACKGIRDSAYGYKWNIN